MTDHAPTTTPRRALRPDIQGLRALAVVAVILDHAIGWPLGGFVGVDVFFVISGFLITGLLLRDVERTGRVSFRDFYAKRMRRILPAALVVLAITAAAGFVVSNVTRAWQTVWDAVYSLVFVANWHFAAQGTDYFHASDAVSPLQHFWSLSVEEQFYLVWPGLVMLLLLLLPGALRPGAAASASGSAASASVSASVSASASAPASASASRMRAVRIVVGVAAAIVVAASFGWAVLQTGSDPTVAYFSTLTRAWELALGAVLAAAVPLLLRLPSALRAVLGWVGLAGIVASFFLIDGGSTPFPGPWAALPVAATAVLIVGGVGGGRQRYLFPLTNPVSVFLGDMSYSLYLWHFPVIVFFAVLLPTPGPTTTGIVLATIGALSLVSYFLVEQPLHRSPLLRSFRVVSPGDPDPVPDARADSSSGAARAGTRYGSGAAGSASAGTGTRYGSGSAVARTGTRYGSASFSASAERAGGRGAGSTGSRGGARGDAGAGPGVGAGSGGSAGSGAGARGASAGSEEGAAPSAGTRYGGGAATTRPPGWTPGSLYSPASAQRLRPGNPRAASSRPAASRPAGAPGPASAAASPADAPPRPHADPTPRPADPAPRADAPGASGASASASTATSASGPIAAPESTVTSGSAAAPPSAATSGSAAASESAAASNPTQPTASATPTPPTPTAPPRVRTREEARAARRAAWGAWRERFGTQFLLSGSGLVVVVVLLALVLQFTVRGGAPLAQFDVDFGGGGAGGGAGGDTSQIADPTPILQDALQQALGATEWPNLSPSLDQVMSRTSSDNPARTCFDPGATPDFGRCTWGSGSAPNHMYLVGDSTAMAYAPAFKKLAEQSAGQWRITTIGLYGCRFTDVLVKNDGAGVMDSCPQRKADVAAQISADSPQLVVVSNAYALGNAASGSPLSASALIASTQTEMAKYGVPGRIVYLAPPPLGADLGTCYSPVTGPSSCAAAVDGAWHDFENAAESAAAASGDHAISSLPFSCWNEMCPAFAGTLPTKYDETHLTVAFSESLSAILRYDLASLGLM